MGIESILSKNGIFLWGFMFGSIYSFVGSDYVQIMVGEKMMKRYAKWQILRLAFFLAGIYASSEATLTYSTVFQSFINDPSYSSVVGWVVLFLSGGGFIVPYLYFRWKYKEKPKDEPPPVLEGL